MTVVFDAEPLLAFAWDEPGADGVRAHLDAVYDGDQTGYVCTVTLTELRYILIRVRSAERADTYIDSLLDMGLQVLSADTLWKRAAQYKAEYGTSLGDAYALAAAKQVDGTLLVGADDDFDAVDKEDSVSIERFRRDPA